MITLLVVGDRAAYTVWWISLAIGLIVIVVVAILLTLIVRTARQIDTAVGRIWVVGQRIANNTVHIPLLHETNRVVGNVLEHAIAIDGAASAIEQHAESCPGCPQCVRGPGRGLVA